MTTTTPTTLGDCRACHRPMLPQRIWNRDPTIREGHVRSGAHGLCNGCYGRQLKTGDPTPPVLPVHPRCQRCRRPMVSGRAATRPRGHVRHAGKGLCKTCHDHLSLKARQLSPGTLTRADLEHHPHWRDRPCTRADSNDFYLADGETMHHVTVLRRLTATARTYCAHCPIREACADAGRNEWGVWGGVLYRHDGAGRRTGTDLLTPEEA